MEEDRDRANFGRKLGEFKTKTSHFAIPLAGGLLLVGLSLVRFVQAITTRAGSDLVGIMLALLGFYLAGVLLFIAFGRYQGMNTRYMLFERGLQRFDGESASQMGWDQVRHVRRQAAAIQSGSGRNKTREKRWNRMQLINQGGESLIISDQPSLAGMVLGMLLVHHWPVIQGQIDEGKTVYLGRVKVSSEGLEYKNRLVPWSRIEKAHTSGHIRLETISGTINWPEINEADQKDVLAFLLLQRAIGYYVG